MTRPMTIKENNGELPMEMSKNIQTNLASSIGDGESIHITSKQALGT
jgi:hypothetical protein